MEPPLESTVSISKNRNIENFPAEFFADELPSGVGVTLIVALAPPGRGIPRDGALRGGSYAYQA